MLELDDLVVLLLGAPTKNLSLINRIEGITRLEKLIFLLERETHLKEILDEKAEFRPYNFGPFSAAVYKSVGYLSGYGLIEDTGSISDNMDDSWEQFTEIGDDWRDPYATRNFTLTDLGIQYYESLEADVRQKGRYIEELTEFKERFASLSLRQLIRYVYLQYPEMTGESLIREDILNCE